ncbi:MAG: FAD-binding oxidoreductase, partial [Pseudomonadota bacterium]
MGYLDANDRVGEHPQSWYAETAGPLPDHAALEADTRADVCIVGGGYAGLSAALHLAEAGRSVVLIEANRIGWGASGRNGGQVASGPRADMDDYVEAVGRDD